MASSLISIANENSVGGASVIVKVQRVSEDGRERHPNGFHVVKAGQKKQIVVDSDQGLEVSVGDEPEGAAE